MAPVVPFFPGYFMPTSVLSRLSFRTLLFSSVVASIATIICWATLLDPKPPPYHASSSSTTKPRPNIVFILTDDQDLHMDSLSHMPLLDKHIRQQGTFFRRHYCTVSICCPSRVTLWTGQAAHNHGVTDVVGHWGGWPRFKERGLNDKYLPVWMQASGYNTFYTGKLFNGHAESNYKDPYPNGWTGSDFLLDPYTYQYTKPVFQRNIPNPTDPSKTIHYPVVTPWAGGKKVYSTTMIHQKGLSFLREAAQTYQDTGNPFFLGIAPIAPHADYRKNAFVEPIAETDADLEKFKNVTVPRVPWFNPEKPSGVSWTYELERLNAGNVSYMDTFYRARLAALQAVDRMVENITLTVEQLGIADNTYIIYTTDNGYHVGQHRMQPGKNCPFETDVNIPFMIRGPGVPKNETSFAVSNHMDVAPTIFDIIGRKIDPGFDGKVMPYKNGSATNINQEEDTGANNNITVISNITAPSLPSLPDHVNIEFWGDWRPEGIFGQNRSTPAWLNFTKYGESATYKALRVIGSDYDIFYSVWCSRRSASGIEHEMYDMTQDPYQVGNLLRAENGTLMGVNDTALDSVYVSVGETTYPVSRLWKRLDALMFVLKTCKQQTCRDPWGALLPGKGVVTLSDAMEYEDAFFDKMRAEGNTVSFQKTGKGNECIEGPVLSASDGSTTMWKGELPVFEGAQSLLERDGVDWSEWT